MGRNRFANFAFFVLAYNVAVIAFGAFVRASFSGDGCGSSWPLCDGSWVPAFTDQKTLIEFTHRMMSALDGIFVLTLVIWAFLRHRRSRSAPLTAFSSSRGSNGGAANTSHVSTEPTRPILIASAIALLFVVFEALIGRGLVKFGWVAHDASAQRAVMLAVHLANTFLLLGSLALIYAWSGGIRLPDFKGQSGIIWALAIGIAGMFLLGISGAITALGDTLYPLHGASTALSDSLDPTKHFLVRLRIIHPLIAASVGLYLILIASVVANLRPSPQVKALARGVASIFLIQICLGLLNVWLKAPVWMQLIHLATADVQWVALMMLALAAVAEGVPRAEPENKIEASEPLHGRALLKGYLLLTKPRVISLLLFTTLAAMFIAAGGWPGLGLFLAVALGGYMSAGAANVINMVLERDLDARMTRTARRPTVTRQISGNAALRFGFALAFGSFALLWWAANLLTALLALSGLVFYVVVYTLVLKRRTWHNIVIGGAAGAFPPLVGWASVTGDLGPLAWTLFGIIFLWTPVHFWALALLIKDDYARAGVPMLPVVRGERATILQIGLYALLTMLITALPLVQGEAGTVYLWSAVVLNLLLLFRCYRLLENPERPRAVSLYKYSMVYLALLFLLLAVDRAGNPAGHRERALRDRAIVGYGQSSAAPDLVAQKAARTTVKASTSDLSHLVARMGAPPALHMEGTFGADLQA